MLFVGWFLIFIALPLKFLLSIALRYPISLGLAMMKAPDGAMKKTSAINSGTQSPFASSLDLGVFGDITPTKLKNISEPINYV